MVLYGVLAVIMLALCFGNTRERVVPPPQQDANLRRDLRDLFSSRPWRVLITVLLLILAAFVIKGSASAYYFKYFLKRQDLLGAFLVSNGLAFLVAVSLTQYLSKWFGKKALFVTAIAAGGVVIAGFFLAGPTDIWLIFALQIISSFVLGFNSPLVFAMFADAADDAEFRTGRRTTGLMFASAIFGTKIGVAVGAWMFGLILAYFGYVANVARARGRCRGSYCR